MKLPIQLLGTDTMSLISNFMKIGEYRSPGEPPAYKEFIGKTKTKKRHCVYAFVVNDEILYIGETRRGFARPLSYHLNKVMHVQRDGIEKYTKSGQIVEVFAKEIELHSFKCPITGTNLNAYVGGDIERHLISICKPKWNGRP